MIRIKATKILPSKFMMPIPKFSQRSPPRESTAVRLVSQVCESDNNAFTQPEFARKAAVLRGIHVRKARPPPRQQRPEKLISV
jgi:hypothetical protein